MLEKHGYQQQQWNNTEIQLADIHPYIRFAVHGKGEEAESDQEALQSQFLSAVLKVRRGFAAGS